MLFSFKRKQFLLSYLKSKISLAFSDTNIHVWETTLPMALEYIRGCQFNVRSDSWFMQNCPDYIHTGYTIIYQSSQILLNFFCNKIVQRP